MSEEVIVVNSTELIKNASGNALVERAESFNNFKEFIHNELKDGIDYGLIPNTKKPCLFKSGGEKIQMLMGLTPVYRLLHREFVANQEKKDKVWNNNTKKYEYDETIRNYYCWEWACELWYGDKKVAEGVGAANSEERKYVSQYSKGDTPDSLANTIMKISKKRAFMDAIIAVSGVSDMFTQDLDEDDDTVNTLKVDKETKPNKLTKNNIKDIYANLGALGLVKTDLDHILFDLGYTNIKECKAEDCNTIILKIRELAKQRKEEQENAK